MLIQKGMRKVKVEREIPHFIMVMDPREARELHSILTGTNIPNHLTTDAYFMGELAKYIEATSTIVETILEEGIVKIDK